eukprot:15461982-Alexandrium_andersonii.AAC.1
MSCPEGLVCEVRHHFARRIRWGGLGDLWEDTMRTAIRNLLICDQALRQPADRCRLDCIRPARPSEVSWSSTQ